MDVIRDAALKSQDIYTTRLMAEEICGDLRSKDYLSEILAIDNFVWCNTRYMRDPRTVELVQAPYLITEQLKAGKTPQIDCLPQGTLLLQDDMSLVPIERVRPGMRIFGKDRWSEVGAVAYKGVLPVSHVKMNNGSYFRATQDHMVYIGLCPKHEHLNEKCYAGADTKPCACSDLSWERVRVGALKPRMRLLSPDRIPFGQEEMDPRRALIDGYYLSDGWCQGASLNISGQDGCPKEEQKREVERICDELGIATTWYRKSISIRDLEWAGRAAAMGHKAPNKHALSINLSEGAARELLRGIMADSGANTHGYGRTFTSTSRQLHLQTRVLHKMFGVVCSEQYIVDHGGLGENPIWRLGVRQTDRSDGKAAKALRVKETHHEITEAPVYDITTDDHYVYLPSADVTVSNCDDMAGYISSLLLSVGCETRVVTVAFRHMFYAGRRQFSHVFAQGKEPKSGTWITCDPVAGVDTDKMLRRVVAAKVWPIA